MCYIYGIYFSKVFANGKEHNKKGRICYNFQSGRIQNILIDNLNQTEIP